MYGTQKFINRVLVRKPGRKRPVRRSRRRCEVSIEMDIKEAGWGRMDWINLDKDRDQWRNRVNIRVSWCWYILA
jgi:hypothetical protein